MQPANGQVLAARLVSVSLRSHRLCVRACAFVCMLAFINLCVRECVHACMHGCVQACGMQACMPELGDE